MPDTPQQIWSGDHFYVLQGIGLVQVEPHFSIGPADSRVLVLSFSFVAEGRRLFEAHFNRLEAEDSDPMQTMDFAWSFDGGESSPS